MKFIFECSNRYPTRSLRSLVRYRFEHSKINFISPHNHVINLYIFFYNNTKQSPATEWEYQRSLFVLFRRKCPDWRLQITSFSLLENWRQFLSKFFEVALLQVASFSWSTDTLTSTIAFDQWARENVFSYCKRSLRRLRRGLKEVYDASRT